MKKSGGSCSALMNFGLNVISLLRKGREALNFYHITQNPDEENPISWNREMYDVWFQMQFDTVTCIRNFRDSALKDIKEAIENEEAQVAFKLEDKFIVYDWSAIQIYTEEQKKHTDFYPKGESNYILNQIQGNDKQLFAIYKPGSKSNVEQTVKAKVNEVVQEWCSTFSYKVKIMAPDVITGISNSLGRYKNYVRGMVAVYRDDTGGTSENFDVNFSCGKPHYHWGNIATHVATSSIPFVGPVLRGSITAGTHLAKGKLLLINKTASKLSTFQNSDK